MKFVFPLRLNFASAKFYTTIVISEDPVANSIDAGDRRRDLHVLHDQREAELAALRRHPCRKHRRQVARLSRAIDAVQAQLDVWMVQNA